MNSRLQFWLVFIVLFTTVAESSAWGPQGHRVVGLIADRHLQPQVKQFIKQKFNINSLADVATWADKRRKKRRQEKPWHYTNIAEGQGTYSADRDCPEKACVTEKILEFSQVLRDRSATILEQAQALKFLVHFVGDVHQPLHLGNQKDRGGGSLHFTYRGRNVSLHYLWDGGLIDWRRTSLLKYAERLNGDLSDIVIWNASTVVDWANESRSLALEVAYKVDEGVLSKAYIEKGQEIIDLRLAQAGVRLANLLNSILIF